MSQSVKTLIQLREMILNGELKPGERLLEVALAEQLQASRTPVRAALDKLTQEGLLEQLPGGGYVIRSFTERDIQDAIQVRGTIEGLAARYAAEQRVSGLPLQKLKEVVAALDALLDNPNLTHDDVGTYLELNDQFHHQLIKMADSFVIERMIKHVLALPFAGPNVFVIANSEFTRSWKIFFVAQEQHRSIAEAIEYGEGARAEALAHEHAYLSLQTLRAAVKNKSVLDSLPGLKLLSK